jgi:hypothetical protein
MDMTSSTERKRQNIAKKMSDKWLQKIKSQGPYDKFDNVINSLKKLVHYRNVLNSWQECGADTEIYSAMNEINKLGRDCHVNGFDEIKLQLYTVQDRNKWHLKTFYHGPYFDIDDGPLATYKEVQDYLFSITPTDDEDKLYIALIYRSREAFKLAKIST